MPCRHVPLLVHFLYSETNSQTYEYRRSKTTMNKREEKTVVTVRTGLETLVIERLGEYCWNCTVWNLEFDETVPLCVHAYISRLRPVIGLFEPTHFDEASNCILPTDQWCYRSTWQIWRVLTCMSRCLQIGPIPSKQLGIICVYIYIYIYMYIYIYIYIILVTHIVI